MDVDDSSNTDVHDTDTDTDAVGPFCRICHRHKARHKPLHPIDTHHVMCSVCAECWRDDRYQQLLQRRRNSDGVLLCDMCRVEISMVAPDVEYISGRCLAIITTMTNQEVIVRFCQRPRNTGSTHCQAHQHWAGVVSPPQSHQRDAPAPAPAPAPPHVPAAGAPGAGAPTAAHSVLMHVHTQAMNVMLALTNNTQNSVLFLEQMHRGSAQSTVPAPFPSALPRPTMIPLPPVANRRRREDDDDWAWVGWAIDGSRGDGPRP
jgi:hypothetical protein